MAELFREKDLNTFLQGRRANMEKYIESLGQEKLAANSLDELVENCCNRFCVEQVELLDEDRQSRRLESGVIELRRRDPFSYQTGTIRVYGLIAEFYFPFNGESALFRFSANKCYLSPYPDAEIRGNYLVFAYREQLKENSDGQTETTAILRRLESDHKVIAEVLSWSNTDAANFNYSLRKDVQKIIERKKAQSDTFLSIQRLLEIPLTKTEYATKHVPLVRRETPLKTRSSSSEPSYIISDSDFMFIWDTIIHNCATYERTPNSFISLGEEDLRNTLLASLNGYYKGSAGGEVFRYKGKTDICIEQENRSAFIAECKMWNGAAEVPKAVEQLLGYTTWRDCKCSLIYFCRIKNFLKCCDDAKAALQKVPNSHTHQSTKPHVFRLTISRTNDPRDQVIIHVLMVNLYTDKTSVALQ